LWVYDRADKRYLHLYVATYEAMVDTKRLSGHPGCTQADRVSPETVSASKGPAAEIMAELGVVVSVIERPKLVDFPSISMLSRRFATRRSGFQRRRALSERLQQHMVDECRVVSQVANKEPPRLCAHPEEPL
jgi:hypothetical protein